jgi:hypothetical protein
LALGLAHFCALALVGGDDELLALRLGPCLEAVHG